MALWCTLLPGISWPTLAHGAVRSLRMSKVLLSSFLVIGRRSVKVPSATALITRIGPLRLCSLVNPSFSVLRRPELAAHAVPAPWGSRMLLAPILGPRLPVVAPLLTSVSSAVLCTIDVVEAYT